jgi:LL-H family phage holin
VNELLLSTLTILLPILIGLAAHFARVLAQRLPEYQAARLEQFASIAVRSVEQQFQDSPEKKAVAQDSIANLFRALKLPVPPPEAIDIAIEAAVFELNRITK